MRCPKCNAPDSRVTDSRDTGQEIRRRRECSECGSRFTTYERLQSAALQVIKRDGRRDSFDGEKLLRSVRLACVKRPLPGGTLEKLVEDIESDLQALGKNEIPAFVIGQTTLARLREIDPVAYVRYASVYRDFDTLDGFIKEIQQYQINDVSANTSSSQLELIPNEFAIPRKPKARRGRKPSINVPNEKDRDNAGTDDTE
ncbi:MAG: transcriptional regulator NrdR [Chloroflexi bacterium]|nr:transcriptional regulator NrdR [Chloroflexota bacterium]